MSKKAIDVVLLPDGTMTKKAIEANRKLAKRYGEKIVLNDHNCLPHISLAMGCIDERDIAAIGNILREITEKTSLPELRVVGIDTSTNSVGEKVSVFEVKKDTELQALHELVMEEFAPYLSFKVTEGMLYNPAEAEPSTLLWIENYREKSSFVNFFPHITIGYGQIENGPFPITFTTSRLALCHLGNHCTCRKILLSIALESG